MEFQGQARQDEFVANILNFKENGCFLDIGSCHAISTNNTHAFESLNWRGICIERNEEHNDSYLDRKCHFINGDATEIDYKSLLEEQKLPSRIDYLSLDIDEQTNIVLKKLPLNDYRFSVITIEHDFYSRGSELRDEQRTVFQGLNYKLLFADVLVPTNDGFPPNCPFEDWWIDPLAFDMNKMSKLASEKLYPKQILSIIKGR